MSAIVRYNTDGTTRTTRSEPIERVRLSESEAGDPTEVAAAFNKLSEQLESLAARLPPRAKEYELTWSSWSGADVVRLDHNFGNRVRWWVVNAEASAEIKVYETTNTDNNTLELSFNNSASSPTLVTVRVEVAA